MDAILNFVAQILLLQDYNIFCAILCSYTQIFQPADDDENSFHSSQLHITEMDLQQVGTYTCSTSNESFQQDESIVLNVTLPVKVVDRSPITKVPIHGHATLWCLFDGYPITKIQWYLVSDSGTTAKLANLTLVNELSMRSRNVSLNLEDLRVKDNGNYTCEAVGGANSDKTTAVIALKILDTPKVKIDSAKALGTNIIYLNWTVNDGNDPENLKYQIQYMDDNTWYYYLEQITGPGTHAVLEDKSFKNNTEYALRMIAINNQGKSQNSNLVKIRTLAKNPEFIPEVKVTGVTVSSITFSWTPLPSDLQEHIHYYQLRLLSFNRTKSIEAIHSAVNGHVYLFKDLASATTYEFQVSLILNLIIM